MKNALTVDLEDYYQVSALADRVARESWNTMTSRVERNTKYTLELLATAGCKATFFTLGCVAERYPTLVQEVAVAGHEVACHSHSHRYVYSLSKQEFFEDTLRAKKTLEDASGQAVLGYRAPSFSITSDTPWAFDVLAELGFTYDSSIFPVQHPNYGIPEATKHPHWIETANGTILEFPMSVLGFGSLTAPFGGGAYLRLLPYSFTRWAIQFVNNRANRPVCVYVHPWEFDPKQPRISSGITTRVRHYFGLRKTGLKVGRLLREFEFESLGSMAAQLYAFKSLPCMETSAVHS